MAAILALASTACGVTAQALGLAHDRHAAEEKARMEREAGESQKGLPLRTEWYCAPTPASGAMTLDCRFKAIDAGTRCGSLELRCADGRHVAAEVCTDRLSAGRTQELRIERFSPPMTTSAADCTRIRFTEFGRGYEPQRPAR